MKRLSPGHAAGRLLLAWLLTGAAGCGPPSDRFGFDSPAGPGSQLPQLAADPRGRPVLSWVEPSAGGHRLVYAMLGDGGWEAAVTVAEGADWFVNWADLPSVQPVDDDLWAAHWLVKQPGGMYSYDVAMTLSRDGGRTWGPPFRPHRDSTATEHGFVSLWPARLEDGAPAVGAVWLDGRHTLLDPSRTTAHEPRMALRSALFDASGDEIDAAEVDDRVCDCCQTGAAVTGEGTLIAYRDRSAGEVRDIHVAAGTPAGWQSWGPVAVDGWVIHGCPVNGPAIAAGNGEVAVAWYTEASGERRVQIVRRAAGATAWSAPAVVDSGPLLGRVDVALLRDGDAAVSWLGRAEDGTAWIMLARARRDGAVGEALPVAATEASRPAGFPRMLRHGDELLLAWTRWQDGVARVVTARVAVFDLPP